MKYPLLKVIVLGDSCVGKTSLVNRFVNQEFSMQYKSSIGADFLTKNIDVDGRTTTLQIWDTAGEERFNALASVFFRGADACVLVCDALDRASFEHLEKWHAQFLEFAAVDEEARAAFPCIVLANKIDCVRQQEGVRAYDKQEANLWRGERASDFVECSAKEDIAVDEAFRAVASLALGRLSADALNVSQLAHDLVHAEAVVAQQQQQSAARAQPSQPSHGGPAADGCSC